jgi:hypothetical protein
MSNVVSPLHVATIRGQQLRLYRTPNTDGRPDFPWHSTDDLIRVCGATREFRRSLANACRSGPFKTDFRTIATIDGLVTITPHYVAQGVISSMAQCIGNTDGNGLIEWMRDALHRHDRLGAA